MSKEYLSVRNLEKFQHYKDRNPVWIKLYTHLLEDYDFSELPDAVKSQLILIWLLASRRQNRLPLDPDWLRKHTGLKRKPNIKLLIDKGFLVVNASTALAACYPREEKKREEKRRPTPTPSAKRKWVVRPKYPPGFSDCYAAYPHFENRTKKAEAGKVWKRLKLEKLNGQVMHWIEAAKQTESWTKDAGQFVPGMQAWLKGQDFSDPPPTPQPSAMDLIRQREHNRHRREFDERNRQTAAREDQT